MWAGRPRASSQVDVLDLWPPGRGVPCSGMSTQWERRERQRAEKLKQIEEQVEDGSLVIREMTPEERKANPPRPAPEGRTPRRRF